MFRKNIFLLVTILLTLNTPLYASSPFALNTINRVVVHDFGDDILVGLQNSDTKNTEGCSNNTEFTLKRNHPFFKEMYAAILVAFHSQTQIVGWVAGCASGFNAPILIRLDLQK